MTYQDKEAQLQELLSTAFNTNETLDLTQLGNGAIQALINLLSSHVATKGNINQLIPNRRPAAPLWVEMLLVVEQFSRSQNHLEKKRKLSALLNNVIKKIGKPAYKRYRSMMTAYGTAIDKDCFVSALILVEDGLDLSLETKYPAVLSAVQRFPIWTDDTETLTDEFELLKAVLKKGYSPNEGSDGYLPLTWACQLSQVPLVELLLEFNADVNRTDNLGATAILHAIDEPLSGAVDIITRHKQVELVELLLQHGATVNIRTAQNRSFHSMVKSCCSADKQREIFSLVKQYLGEAALVPPKKPPTRVFNLLLNSSQIAARSELNSVDKRDQIEWIIARFKENGVKEFETGHIASAFKALKLPTYPISDDIRKCSNSEAKKYLKSIIRRKKIAIENIGDKYRIL